LDCPAAVSDVVDGDNAENQRQAPMMRRASASATGRGQPASNSTMAALSSKRSVSVSVMGPTPSITEI